MKILSPFCITSLFALVTDTTAAIVSAVFSQYIHISPDDLTKVQTNQPTPARILFVEHDGKRHEIRVAQAPDSLTPPPPPAPTSTANGANTTIAFATMSLAGVSALDDLEFLSSTAGAILTLSKNTLVVTATASSTTTSQPTSMLPLSTSNANTGQALVQQSLQNAPQTNATVSSAMPWFANGIIAFAVHLSGQASTFILNASTTIAAGDIATNPNTQLVLMPKTVKNTTSTSVTDTANIIAVNAIGQNHIFYYVQLSNGSTIELASDKLVHGIDQMDPTASTELVILPESLANGPALSKRSSEEASAKSLNARGLQGISANTVTVTAEACSKMTCLSTGDPPMFNSFTNACYCQTMEPDVTVPATGGAGTAKREEHAESNKDTRDTQRLPEKRRGRQPCGSIDFSGSGGWPCYCPSYLSRSFCEWYYDSWKGEGISPVGPGCRGMGGECVTVP